MHFACNRKQPLRAVFYFCARRTHTNLVIVAKLLWQGYPCASALVDAAVEGGSNR